MEKENVTKLLIGVSLFILSGIFAFVATLTPFGFSLWLAFASIATFIGSIIMTVAAFVDVI